MTPERAKKLAEEQNAGRRALATHDAWGVADYYQITWAKRIAKRGMEVTIRPEFPGDKTAPILFRVELFKSAGIGQGFDHVVFPLEPADTFPSDTLKLQIELVA